MKSIKQLWFNSRSNDYMFLSVVAIIMSLSFNVLQITYIIVWRCFWWRDLYIKTQAITRSHTDLPYTATQSWMKKHAISQTRTRTLQSSLPTTWPRGSLSPPFLIFLFFVFYDFFAPYFVFVSWFFLSPILVPYFFGLLILSQHTFMYYKAVHPHTI